MVIDRGLVSVAVAVKVADNDNGGAANCCERGEIAWVPTRWYGVSKAMSTARKLASYEDLLALPDHVVGEIVDGELHAQPRPRIRHARASTALGEELGQPYGRGRGGPGGWIFLDEPELHLGADVLVPDLAGWRNERLPDLPDEAYLTLAPDWVCEVLSPSTERLDRGGKMRVFALEHIGYVWLLNPTLELLEGYVLEGPRYSLAQTFEGEASVRAVPFDAIDLELPVLWGPRREVR